MKTLDYILDTASLKSFLQLHDEFIELSETHKIKLGHTYYNMGLKGTLPKMYVRKGVWILLNNASHLLPQNLAFYIYDCYRSLETQKDLFLFMRNYLIKNQPHLNDHELLLKTREFVADPFDTLIAHKLSHPSGGAIDLSLFNLETNKEIDMGTTFDDPSIQSSTLYYEYNLEKSTQSFRSNRMLLRDIMLSTGFTNYSKEWWHFDLGDFSWSKKMNLTWYYSICEKI